METCQDLASFIEHLKSAVRRLVGNPCVTPITEYELIKALASESWGFFTRDSLQKPESLFHVHFSVFHCLYQLRDEFLSSGVGLLEISPLQIVLKPLPEQSATSQQAMQPADALGSYYKDIENLRNTSPQDIHDLLNAFWTSLSKPSSNLSGRPLAREEALQTLGCSTTDSPATIRKAYRRLAAIHHPDRGGKDSDFIAIRRAFEAL
jgi:hypothetical protein